jgi:hypothetical protein
LILEAESDEAVNAVLAGHPHAAQGGTIEVHRFLDLPGSEEYATTP